ncbi:MAG: nucleoside monophosphate kinase [Patescibacteria group bacterium]
MDPASLNIILMGCPGSGKSTQGELLVQKYNLKLIQTGKIYRNIAATGTELGKKIKRMMESGQLIDDQTTFEVIDKNLKGIDGGYLIDGYPRTLGQAKWNLFEVGMVIYINLPDEIAIARMMKRERSDDTVESLKIRMQLFHKETEPILNYFKEQGKLFVVDGQPRVEEIHNSIVKIFEKKNEN